MWGPIKDTDRNGNELAHVGKIYHAKLQGEDSFTYMEAPIGIRDGLMLRVPDILAGLANMAGCIGGLFPSGAQLWSWQDISKQSCLGIRILPYISSDYKRSSRWCPPQS